MTGDEMKSSTTGEKGDGETGIDKRFQLEDHLEQQLNEFADIIVEFYREWKRQ